MAEAVKVYPWTLIINYFVLFYTWRLECWGEGGRGWFKKKRGGGRRKKTRMSLYRQESDPIPGKHVKNEGWTLCLNSCFKSVNTYTIFKIVFLIIIIRMRNDLATTTWYWGREGRKRYYLYKIDNVYVIWSKKEGNRAWLIITKKNENYNKKWMSVNV